MVRNHRGLVLYHSRRAFANIFSRDEAKLEAILWAAESMSSHRFNKVILAGEMKEMFGAVTKPREWPAFGFQRQEIIACLAGIEDWKVMVINKEANRGAAFIAESVNRHNLVQSYVATGHPDWLFEFFVNESWFL